MSEQPTVILSDHPPRSPLLYQVKRAMTLIGLALCAIALLGAIALALIYGSSGHGGALLLLAVLTAGLAVPLVIGSVLTPPVSVTSEGLVLRPMFGPPLPVRWEALRAVRPYTLLPVEEPFTRLFVGKAHMPRSDGRWVLAAGDALPLSFRLIAWLTGLGNQPVFGISDATHAGYDRLLAAVEAHVRPQQ